MRVIILFEIFLDVVNIKSQPLYFLISYSSGLAAADHPSNESHQLSLRSTVPDEFCWETGQWVQYEA
jgi:hypothetical protein